eukprot:3843270-Karenia_brevis.AAC.1
MTINPLSAWAQQSHHLRSSPSSHVAASLSSSSHTVSSLIPSDLMNSYQKVGVTGPTTSQEDVPMEVDGAGAPAPPPTPLAQSHLQKMQELEELQEAYQQSLMEKGEHHAQTKALAQGIKSHGPQVSQVKTLSTQSSLQQVLLNGTKKLNAMKE